MTLTKSAHDHMQYIPRVFIGTRRRIVPCIAWARKIFRRLHSEQAQRS